VPKFEERTFGVAQALSELATLFPAVSIILVICTVCEL